MATTNQNIPENTEGIKTDTTSSVTLNSVQEAAEHFRTVKDRFLNIARWGEIGGKGRANFMLTDSEGNEITRTPIEGDHIKIDVPGPGTDKGHGFEWVRIERIDNQRNSSSEDECIIIKVSPSENPRDNSRSIAHFFHPQASSSFVIKRKGKTVYAEVHGRNEKPNTYISGFFNLLRNFFMAIGAMMGASKFQWKSLVNGLVKKQD